MNKMEEKCFNSGLVSCLEIIIIRREIKFTYRAGWTWLPWKWDLVVQVSC